MPCCRNKDVSLFNTIHEFARSCFEFFLFTFCSQVFEAAEASLVHRAIANREYGSHSPAVLALNGIVLRLRGLPFTAEAEDVLEFIRPIIPVEGPRGVIFKCNIDGRPSGEAFLLLYSEENGAVVLSKNKQRLGRRYIEIFRSSKIEVYHAVVHRGIYFATKGSSREIYSPIAGRGRLHAERSLESTRLGSSSNSSRTDFKTDQKAITLDQSFERSCSLSHMKDIKDTKFRQRSQSSTQKINSRKVYQVNASTQFTPFSYGVCCPVQAMDLRSGLHSKYFRGGLEVVTADHGASMYHQNTQQSGTICHNPRPQEPSVGVSESYYSNACHTVYVPIVWHNGYQIDPNLQKYSYIQHHHLDRWIPGERFIQRRGKSNDKIGNRKMKATQTETTRKYHSRNHDQRKDIGIPRLRVPGNIKEARQKAVFPASSGTGGSYNASSSYCDSVEFAEEAKTSRSLESTGSVSYAGTANFVDEDEYIDESETTAL